ncbi:MAG: spore maturation protein [Pirellulales bacterium]|nr:spore maturation protein [Pirellulales bacterium]
MHSLFEMPFREVMDTFSQWVIPVVMLLIVVWAALKRVPMYESFVTGAKEGFDVAVMIIPYLVAMLFVIKVFMASGFFDDLKTAVVWVMGHMGLGAYTETLDVLPLALIRPLSGSGAQGVLNDIYSTHGPDSFIGLMASTMMGSTETTFYVITVYFGAVQVKKMRHTLPACLIADAAGIIAAVVLAYILFA